VVAAREPPLRDVRLVDRERVVLAMKLFTRTDFTGRRKSRLKLESSWVVLARMVAVPVSRSVAGL
jgi:hypothetical protein